MGTEDWALVAAIIAVIVGIGSLGLTWLSTRAAKRAIDTSIEIYEKQKIDSEQEIKKTKELKLKAIKNIVRSKLESNYVSYGGVIRVFDEIKSGNDIQILFQEFEFNDFTISCHDGKAKSFNKNIPPVCDSIEILYEVSLLDDDFSKMLIDLNDAHTMLIGVLDIFIKSANNTTYSEEFKLNNLRSVVSYFYYIIDGYGKLIEILYPICGGDKSLSDIYGDYKMN